MAVLRRLSVDREVCFRGALSLSFRGGLCLEFVKFSGFGLEGGVYEVVRFGCEW